MSKSVNNIWSMALCSRCIRKYNSGLSSRSVRPFSQRTSARTPVQVSSFNASTEVRSTDTELDLTFAHTKLQLQEAAKNRTPLVGSLRSRWARSTNDGVPFEQLPYQCFQEARKVLAEHRNEVLEKIESMRGRIARLSDRHAETQSEITSKQASLVLMRKKLEKLKIEADINDPLVKKRFEDGMGDMNKPVYRHLADKKWREYKRLLVLQRLTQMSVTPDVIESIDLVASIDIAFPGAKSQPGEFVQSLYSQHPPKLDIQVYDAGPRLISILVVDSDVPDLENDSFQQRCHGLYTNIEISPTDGKINLSEAERDDGTAVLSWLPPFALKGSPYHRLSVFVLEHLDNKPINIKHMRQWIKREDFNTRKFLARTRLNVVGATMFRTQWDEGTAEVMERHNLAGLDIQLKRKSPEKGPYKKRDTSRMRG